MKAAIDALVAEAGRLDIVIVNAGINGHWAPIDESQPAEWDLTHSINLRGSYLTIHFTVPHLKAAGGGNIILISSINGTRVFSTGGRHGLHRHQGGPGRDGEPARDRTRRASRFASTPSARARPGPISVRAPGSGTAKAPPGRSSIPRATFR